MRMRIFRRSRIRFRGAIALLLIVLFAPSLRGGGTNEPGPDARDSDAMRFLASMEAIPFDATETPAPPPPAATTQPSLQDLGFTSEQTAGNVEAQARLDRRSRMLKTHQRLGLITLVPMLATVLTGGGAKNHAGSSSSARNVHGALGILTAGLYVTTASYAIRAPSLPGTETRGPIRLHKALAWIHGAGMILTPILGAMARSQLDRGEKVHGIASAHSAVAGVTVAAYAAAIGAVAIKF
jgi:hypothetical protein